ncbi:uncharacterized protein JCM6883_002781 [Sporobolomyces salmoneus]|uniref:uncharacterized protein n=1 Tax=Sporobolomyces salmoneus TaxID=183962 RepID=UPI003171D6C7
MSETIQRDFISHLPPELLADIFDHAYKDSEPPRSPISRVFLSFQRQALFRRVQISSLSQLEQLIQAYENNGGLGRMVKVLEVENVDTGGGALRNDRQMKSFFATLVNLEQLKLGAQTTSLINVILSLRIAHSSLLRLETLKIEIPPEWKKPFDSKLYRSLDEYPSLSRLEFSTAASQLFACNPRGGKKLFKINELVLRGVWADNPRTLSFVQNFPNLSSLTLDTLEDNTPSFTNLVAILPATLTSLTLRTRCFYDEYSHPCDQHFPRFVNLEHLYLSRGTFSQDLIKPLKDLAKLKTLGFGKGAFLSCSRLEEMIIGPNRLPSLGKVVFDQVQGKVGWRINEDSDGYTLHPDHEQDPLHVGPGWIIPRWDEANDFAEKAVVNLISRIRQSGIKVEGTTIESIEIGEELNKESFDCMFAHAVDGNWEEFREVYGDEMTDDLLLDEAGYYDYGGCPCGESHGYLHF